MTNNQQEQINLSCQIITELNNLVNALKEKKSPEVPRIKEKIIWKVNKLVYDINVPALTNDEKNLLVEKLIKKATFLKEVKITDQHTINHVINKLSDLMMLIRRLKND